MPEITPNLDIKKPTGNEVVTRQSFNEKIGILLTKTQQKTDLDGHLTDDAPHHHHLPTFPIHINRVAQ